MKPQINLKKDTFIMCSFFPVGLEDYVEFFKVYFDNFIYLKWKFPHSTDKKSYSSITLFKNGRIVSEEKLSTFSIKNKKLYFVLLPINYLQYFFQAFKLRRHKTEGKKVFFGINYFCTFCGIILKKLGFVDHVVYRVMDFFPLPPNGVYRLLNRIFYKFDKFCLRNSDSIWFTTEGHIIGREKYGYFNREEHDYEIIPLGIKKEKITFSEPVGKAIVYCGVVSRYHQLDLIFKAIKPLSEAFKDFKFNLIGSGPDLDYFKKMAENLKINDHVNFFGYLEEDDKFKKIMSQSSLGIALYKDEENFMKYTEPAKVKYYLNFGIPVIISKVPQIAEELDQQKVSFAVENDSETITATIINYLSNPKMQEEYRKNIKDFLRDIDVDKMLLEKIKKSFNIKG